MKRDSSEWESGFREFLEAEEKDPPAHLSRQVREGIHTDLTPSPWFVFARLMALTAASGMVSLFICPQFGFGQSVGIMRYFMLLGPAACSLACGAVFIGFGLGLAVCVLRPEEVRVIHRTKYLHLAVLAALSLSGFICAGASVVLTVALLWMSGAILGGLTVLELSHRVRFRAS